MKYITLAFPLVLSVGLLGCEGKHNHSHEEAKKEGSVQQDEFVSKLPADAPVIKVGTEANYPPYEFKDEYGNVTGFDIDLVRAIGEKQGFKVEIHNDPWEQLFTNFESGNRDMVAAGLGHNEDRVNKYGVSNTYIYTPMTIAYLDPKLDIKSVDDFRALKIGVIADSSVSEKIKAKDYINNVEEFPTLFLAIQAMIQGKVDGVISDDGVLRYTLAEIPDISPKFFDYEPDINNNARTIFLVSKNNPELLSKVNSGIDALMEDGTYGKITTKWFGTDMTKQVIEKQIAFGEKNNNATVK